jgi:two-component system, LytTR family, sensor histidine kinase AlgZ
MQTRFGHSRLDLGLDSRQAALRDDAQLDALDEHTPVWVFDACHVGLVLRAVLLVQTLVAVGVMFAAPDMLTWITHFAIATAASLPATLLWLLAACSLKKHLQKLNTAQQALAGALLGALAGVYACAMLGWIGAQQQVPWLASGLAGALVALALVAMLIWRAQQLAPRSDAARLQELQSRIRPHFLFNTLNSAIALIRAEPSKAENMLEDLSELFRSALVEQGVSSPLAREVELARSYLAIEQIRFGDRLRVTWQIDSNTLGAKLPPLVLQPLVENAVKHGVEPSSSGADVKISTEKRGSTVVVKITNTAPAGQGEPGHGVALDNVRERLRLLHDVQAQFRCTWVGGIYQVRMEIPA